MEAPAHESWQADSSAGGYQGHKVESTFHQPADDHGEQEPCSRNGNEDVIQQSDVERGGDRVGVLGHDPAFQQPPVGANYQKRRSALQDPLSNSDGHEDGDKREQSTTQRYNETDPSHMQHTGTLASYFFADEDGSNPTQLAHDIITQETHRNVGNEVIEPTLKGTCEVDGDPNLLQLPLQSIIRNAREEPEFPINPFYSLEENQELWQTAELAHFGVKNQPTLILAPPNDCIGGGGDHSLQGRDIRDENDVKEVFDRPEGVLSLEQLRQLMYPGGLAADHEHKERAAGMEGSYQEHADLQDPDTLIMLLANTSLVDASLSSDLHDGSSLPAQLAHGQWTAAPDPRWYNDRFLSTTLQNGAEYPQNSYPSGEGTSGESSSYPTQEMTLDFGTSRSHPAPEFITPIPTSATYTFPRNASNSFFTSIEAAADGHSSLTQPELSEAAQFASHREWAGYLSQTEDGSSTYSTADLVSHAASSNSQTPLEPLSLQERWQYNPMASSATSLEPVSLPENWQYNLNETNLDASQNPSGQIPLPLLLQKVTASSTQAASLDWSLPDASSISTHKDAAESISSEKMATVCGNAWNQSPHVPLMHKSFVEGERERETNYRLGGSVEEQTQREERQPKEKTMIYWGGHEKQQHCICEVCQAQRGTGTVLTSYLQGYNDEQQHQCACHQCQLQMGTGAYMTTVHELEGIEEQQAFRWQEVGDGTTMRVNRGDVQQKGKELQREIGACTLPGNLEQADRHCDPDGRGSGYATDYGRGGIGQQQMQIDFWPEGVGNNRIVQASDQQLHYHDQTECEQKQSNVNESEVGCVKFESESEENFEQRRDGDEMQPGARDLSFESGAEESEPWEEGQARLKQRLSLWKKARFRARVVTHPIFPQLLQAHIDCIRMMTPACEQEDISQQLEDVQSVYEKYLPFAPQHPQVDDIHLDQFLKAFLKDIKKYQTALGNNLKVQATPAYARLWRTERTLFQLTGIRIPDRLESGPTMSDDSGNDASDDSDADNTVTAEGAPEGSVQDPNYEMDAENDGSYVPTPADRAAMQSIRQDLINRLGLENYRKQIKEVRDEILRKRRAGKLPEGTTGVLKAWWQAHSNWPYPTEEEKEELMKETGLELKQVNNWFINQRKRNWHTNPLTMNKDKVMTNGGQM